MAKRNGLSIEGIASEIGALSRTSMKVDKEKLIASLCRRYGAEEYEVLETLKRAINSKALKEMGNEICIRVRKEIHDCPFCGSENVVMNVASDGKQIGYVVCRDCEAQGPLKDFDEIVKSWNRRVG